MTSSTVPRTSGCSRREQQERRYTGPIKRALFLIALLVGATPAHAQRVEVTPFVGYRGGGGPATINGRPVSNTPGGPSAGLVVDVVLGPLQDGRKVEFLFSRERADVRAGGTLFEPAVTQEMHVDQLSVGGLYDLSPGRIRPFLAGGVGLTRFAAPDATSVNFMVGGGAGAKFYANDHVGLRLDGRLYVTILDTTVTGVCGGGCVLGFRVSPATQFEFTAGIVVAF